MYSGNLPSLVAMPGTTVTPGERSWIVQMHKAGVDSKTIAAQIQRSYGTVLRILKESRVETSRRGPWDLLADEQKNQCKKDYQRGYCTSYLSKIYGVTPQRLLQEFQKSDLQSPTNRVTGIEKLHDCREAVIHDYTTDSIGMREVARRFGVHEGTVRVFLEQEVGIKARGGQPGEMNGMTKGRQVGQSDRDHGKYWARRTVEIAIGRKLAKGWVIHHMNENPRDQRQSNLWLFPNSESHGTYHARQLDRLAAGGLIPASQTASENGGLWLPELLALAKSEPDKAEQLLSCTQA